MFLNALEPFALIFDLVILIIALIFKVDSGNYHQLFLIKKKKKLSPVVAISFDSYMVYIKRSTLLKAQAYRIWV